MGLTVVIGVLVGLLLVAVASSAPVSLAERSPSLPFDLPTLDLTDAPANTLPPDPEGGASTQQADVSGNLRSYLQNLVLLGAAASAIWMLGKAWRHRPDLLWRPTPLRDHFAVLEEIAAAVTADAAEQRAALERGEARNAIVACWSHLEELVERHGFERDPADTTAEFTARVLSHYPVAPQAIDGLSALYREARFSTHDMGESERAAALGSLDEIHAGLRTSSRRSTETATS